MFEDKVQAFAVRIWAQRLFSAELDTSQANYNMQIQMTVVRTAENPSKTLFRAMWLAFVLMVSAVYVHIVNQEVNQGIQKQ